MLTLYHYHYQPTTLKGHAGDDSIICLLIFKVVLSYLRRITTVRMDVAMMNTDRWTWRQASCPTQAAQQGCVW